MFEITLAAPNPTTYFTLSQVLKRHGHRVHHLIFQTTAELTLIPAQTQLLVVAHSDFKTLTSCLDHCRELTFRAKVLLLTKQLTYPERLELWKRGADDQLTIPFEASECSVRCQRLLHYEKVLPAEALASSTLTFQPKSGLLLKPSGQATRLRRREADIFSCLLRHRNQVVSRDMLIKWVWSGQTDIPTYSTIDVYLRRIRMALRDCGEVVKTVRGYGYMLCD
jgi:DNA-binding response OmpR family regulator